MSIMKIDDYLTLTDQGKHNRTGSTVFKYDCGSLFEEVLENTGITLEQYNKLNENFVKLAEDLAEFSFKHVSDVDAKLTNITYQVCKNQRYGIDFSFGGYRDSMEKVHCNGSFVFKLNDDLKIHELADKYFSAVNN